MPPRIFYGWVIVAVGAVIQFLAGGLHHFAYGAYFVLLQRDMGWDKTALSAAYSLARMESGFLGPVEGWLVDRFGPRAIMRVGLVIFGGGFILMSQVQTLPWFFVAFALLALGSGLSSFLPLSVAIINWFQRRRTRALATAQLGYAMGGLAVPIVVIALETFGWRATALASGIVVMVVGIPLAQLVRHRPEDYGMQVDGGPAPARDSAQPARTGKAERTYNFRPSEAVRTRAFWFISLGHGSALLVVSAVMVHLVAHLNESLGYSLSTAGLVVSFMTVMQMVGILLGGYLGDRYSKRLLAAGCMAMHMTGLLLVAYATTLPMVLAFAALHGVAWGVRGPLMQAIRADYFGRAAFGVIVGLSSMVTTIGNTLGPLVAGVLADRTGSYQIGLTVLALMAGVGSLLFVLATKPEPPRERAGEELRPVSVPSAG